MSSRLTQKDRNLAKQMFATSDRLNREARAILLPDLTRETDSVDNLKDLEDDLLHVVYIVRELRFEQQETVIHKKGQNA